MRKKFFIGLAAFMCLGLITQAQDKGKPRSSNPNITNGRLIKKSDLPKQHQNLFRSPHASEVSRNQSEMDNIDGFLETPNGLLYKFIRKKKEGATASAGDLAMLNVEFWMGDSLLFNTKKVNANQAVPEHLKEPQYRGDVYEGILMMKPGELAIFKTTLAEFSANTNTPIPDYIQAGNYVTWRIEMVDLKSQKDLKAEEEKLSAEEDKAIQKYLKEHQLKGEKTEEGVYIVQTKKGSGNMPQKGQNVSVNYTGKLMDGTAFDSNVDPKFNHVAAFVFPVGEGKVIKGWDIALQKMKKGEHATVIIPSRLAYGKNSPTPSIPSNSILIFDVELVDVID